MHTTDKNSVHEPRAAMMARLLQIHDDAAGEGTDEGAMIVTFEGYVSGIPEFFTNDCQIRDEVVDFNPCSTFEHEQEARRERYLTPNEQVKLMEVLVDDLEHLRVPIEVSLGTGVRKHTELLKLKIENVNFSGLSVFRPANGRDVEVRPNWFLLVDTKGKRPRHCLMPMNGPVRSFAESNR